MNILFNPIIQSKILKNIQSTKIEDRYQELSNNINLKSNLKYIYIHDRNLFNHIFNNQLDVNSLLLYLLKNDRIDEFMVILNNLKNLSGDILIYFLINKKNINTRKISFTMNDNLYYYLLINYKTYENIHDFYNKYNIVNKSKNQIYWLDLFNRIIKNENLIYFSYFYGIVFKSMNRGFRSIILLPHITKYAIKYSRIDILIYIKNETGNWGREDLLNAVKFGQLNIVKYFLKEGVSCISSFSNISALSGNLDILKYLHESGCGWTDRILENSVIGGSLNCFKYLMDNLAPFDNENIFETIYRAREIIKSHGNSYLDFIKCIIDHDVIIFTPHNLKYIFVNHIYDVFEYIVKNKYVNYEKLKKFMKINNNYNPKFLEILNKYK